MLDRTHLDGSSGRDLFKFDPLFHLFIELRFLQFDESNSIPVCGDLSVSTGDAFDMVANAMGMARVSETSAPHGRPHLSGRSGPNRNVR